MRSLVEGMQRKLIACGDGVNESHPLRLGYWSLCPVGVEQIAEGSGRAITPVRVGEGFRVHGPAWLSSFGTDFNYDLQVTLDETHTEYNYAPVSAQPAGRPHEGEREGLSVFLREGKRLFHTYSTYQRGLDPFLNTYNFLDLTPLGRQEEEGIMKPSARRSF